MMVGIIHFVLYMQPLKPLIMFHKYMHICWIATTLAHQEVFISSSHRVIGDLRLVVAVTLGILLIVQH